MSIDDHKTITTASSKSSVPSHHLIGEEEPEPKAKASYEEVVANEGLFMETLEDLHKTLGTKFLVPIIGGKSIDLHLLFVEVTRRGGLQKVTGDRKWRDVTSAFTFPSTVTSASYVLRKRYISLLQTYEQLYFFRKGDFNQSSSEHAPLRAGGMVTGRINGKFENGYIVTANFGSDILNGVLYHVPLQPVEPDNFPPLPKRREQKRSRKETDVSDLKSNTDGYNVLSPPPPKRHGRKRSRKVTDVSDLKSNTDGYNVFFVEHYSELRPLYSGKEKVIVKQISSLWNSLTESEKEVYHERDRARRKTSL